MNLEDLIITEPDPAFGVAFQRDAVAGEWRFVLELADPTDPYVDWLDLSMFYVGDRHQFGADQYMGRARARLVDVQLQMTPQQAADLDVSEDILAPWGQDTTDLFGVDVTLGAGLLMRAGMIRVVAGVVEEWEPIWTGRVEAWGDASAARGQIRTHVVSVVDLMSDLANVPVVIPLNSDEWPDWYTDQLLPAANWLFGVDIYGDPTFSGLPLVDTPTAAINLMDAGADTVGVVWRTLRNGRMVIHPAPWDTQHTERYPNPLLDVYPDGLVFNFSPSFTDIEYIADDDQQPFGVTRTIAGVLNSFLITAPGPDEYAIDDPVSIGRYGVRPFTASWLVGTHTPADDLLAARAYAESQALPLRTTLDHEGFWSALAIVDHLDPVTVVHATYDTGLVVTATGTIRNIVEERTVRGDGLLNWQSTVQVDIASSEVAEALLPVEDLAFISSMSPGSAGPSSAEFTWTNPTQPSITPTEVEYRVIGKSLIWNPKDYPGVGADGMTLGWLDAGTAYTLQVRLIRRVNGVITNASPIREVDFFTPNRIFPVPIPGDDPTDTDVDMPPFDDCEDDVSIELQENDFDPDSWVTVDTFSGTEIEQDDEGHWHLSVPIPNSFFNVGSMYRYLGFCGDDLITTGPSFEVPADWTDPCTTPSALSTAPFDDPSLLVYVPKICTGFEDADPAYLFQGMLIVEAVSGIAGVHGDALAEIRTGIADPTSHALVAIADPDWSDTPGGIVAYGECPQIAGKVQDKSIAARVNVADDTVSVVLFECAAMRLTCTPVSGGGWRPGVTVYKVGSTVSLAGASVLDVDTAYTLLASHNYATGDITLYIDAVEDNSVGGTDNVATISALPIWRCGVPPESWITDCAIWDTVIVPDVPDVPLLSNVIHWYDISDTASLTPGTGSTVNAIADKVGSADMSASHSNEATLTNLGTTGLQGLGYDASTGGTSTREFTTAAFTALDTGTTALVVAWVGWQKHTQGTFFDTSSSAPRPTANVGSSTFRIDAGSNLSGGASDMSPHVFLAVFNGASSAFYIDDDTTPVASGSTGTGDTNANAALFNVYTSSSNGFAVLGEIVFATGVPSSGEITAEMTRLRDKWGIVVGGTVTESGGYFYHTFTAGGTFKPGPAAPLTVDYIVVGGGGGGGGWHRGGGGGGGQAVVGAAVSISTNQTITIGGGGSAGGTGSSPGPAGNNGGTTTFGSITSAVGGGRGGGGDNAYAPNSGGSGGGGGGAATGSPHAGASAGSALANAGGQGASANTAGGGGGGAGSAGVAASSTSNGGAGTEWPASSGVFYAGGGGGGRFTSFGAGGSGGGGNGGGDNASGSSGTTGKGGGGGGAGNFSSTAQSGGAGGSGVVVIRYPV